VDIMTAIAAASQAVDLVKSLNELGKQYDQAEFKAKAAELLSNVADLKVTLVEANDAIRERDTEIERLKGAFQLKEKTIRIENAFLYEMDDKGRPFGPPFCPRCEQVDGFMIKVVKADGPMGNMACPRCNQKYFHVGTYRHAD
jgi:hypothetical protein